MASKGLSKFKPGDLIVSFFYDQYQCYGLGLILSKKDCGTYKILYINIKTILEDTVKFIDRNYRHV